MANLILRYMFYSKKTDLNIHEITKTLNTKNVSTIYALGDIFGTHIRKTNSIQYKYKYKKINSIDDVCKNFISEWADIGEKIIELHEALDFKSILLFEFDLESGGHPELTFTKEFLSFLANVGSELQLYFYTDK